MGITEHTVIVQTVRISSDAIGQEIEQAESMVRPRPVLHAQVLTLRPVRTALPGLVGAPSVSGVTQNVTCVDDEDLLAVRAQRNRCDGASETGADDDASKVPGLPEQTASFDAQHASPAATAPAAAP